MWGCFIMISENNNNHHGRQSKTKGGIQQGQSVDKCLKCEKIGERWKIDAHYLKLHEPLENNPYYCRLCMFQCTRQSEIDWHVTGY